MRCCKGEASAWNMQCDRCIPEFYTEPISVPLPHRTEPHWTWFGWLVRQQPLPSLMEWDWVHLVLRSLFGLLYQPQMTDDDDDCGAIGGMRIGKGNPSTRRNPVPVTLCPTKNPTRPNRDSNPGRRGRKPATNRHGPPAALICEPML
jgi:hypothetical protein